MRIRIETEGARFGQKKTAPERGAPERRKGRPAKGEERDAWGIGKG